MEMPDGLKDIDVVILAGGRGTRLQSVSGDLPKPLCAVNGRPFLAYLLDQVRGAGARRVVLSLGYKPDAFLDFVKQEGLETSVECTPLGTAGALRAALPLLRGDDVLEKIATVPTKSGGGGEKSTPIDRVEVESVRIAPAAA